MRAAAIFVLAAVLAGCGFKPEKLFSSYANIEVREVGRSLYCNSEGDQAQARILPDLKAVMDWQSARGVTVAVADTLAPAPYALVEMGARPTGGYGLAVAHSAVLRGDLVILSATFLSPSPGSLRTQALSTPCVLVQLPPGRYAQVEVRDQSGTVRASGGIGATQPAPAAPAAPEPATQPAPGAAVS